MYIYSVHVLNTCYFIYSVPLIPRDTPVVPDSAAEEKAKRKSTLELMAPPREDISGLELDEQLIVHSYNNAIAGIFKLVLDTCTFSFTCTLPDPNSCTCTCVDD